VVELFMVAQTSSNFTGNINWFRFDPLSAGQLGSISGAVYVDTNNNGVRDAGEAGNGGRRLYLDLNGDGIFGNEPDVTADASGHYVFPNLPLGNYVVRLTPSGGEEVTTSPIFGGKYYVELGQGENVSGEDFGTLPAHEPRAVFPRVTGQVLLRTGAPVNGQTPVIVTEYNFDGSINTNFGHFGVATVGQFDEFGGDIQSIVIRSDGFVVLWRKSDHFNVQNYLTLLSGTGANLGTTSIGFFASEFSLAERINQIAIELDDKVVVVGTHVDSFAGQPNNYQFVRRYNMDFSPDLTFGDKGSVTLPVDPSVLSTNLFVEPNGSIEVRYPTGRELVSPTGVASPFIPFP
jgi:hypothetical protein